MVAVRHADGAIAAVAAFARDHAAYNARHVGLIGDHHQVHHQPRVVAERLRDGSRALHYRQRDVGVLLFGHLDAALDVADGIQVLGQLAAVGSAQPAGQAVNVSGDVIENAALLVQAGQAGRRISAFVVAKQPLEDGARADFHGVGRGGAAPGNSVGVGATITGIAVAGQRG